MGESVNPCFMLTAGQGTRLKPYTDFSAKPTLPFLNLPLAYYGFYLAAKGGFSDFLMNKHHLPEQIEQLAKELRPFATSVTTIDETRQLLGSGGALWNARDHLKNSDYFLIANGDEVLFPTDESVIQQLVDQFLKTSSLCALLTCDHPDLLKSLKPVWVDAEGFVKGFGMTAPSEDLKPVHYTGYKVFSPKIFDYLPEGESNIFYEVLVEAIQLGEVVTTLQMQGASWQETGNPQAFLDASQRAATEQWENLQKRRAFFDRSPLCKKTEGKRLLVTERQEELRFFDQCQEFAVLGAGSTILEQHTIKQGIVFSGKEYVGAPDPQVGLFI